MLYVKAPVCRNCAVLFAKITGSSSRFIPGSDWQRRASPGPVAQFEGGGQSDKIGGTSLEPHSVLLALELNLSHVLA